ncbi:ABC transporter ATP-binding protein [Petralouisia muris]|uniref:ABC transporter ATP-binding protein n=1 Tax=Petralouisia muris TaxID=3032872 RepID=A0AC61S275_9FIRM|nr:ABC transporter ATP-binding protein [Petralouisia muris]TGY98402.1 ABC transporter ATP-binding protein [Petralouisia muris]
MVHAIEFQNVTKAFQGSLHNAVDQINFTAEEGEFITILGSSGCGKTTLLKMINRLYEPDAGTIIVFGENISTLDPVKLRRRIGYVIQQIGLFPHMTVGDNIAMIPNLLKWEKEKTEARINQLLTMAGLAPEEFKNRYPAQLSGGQQQRVGLARALAADPKIMLLDEPFGAIDSITRTRLQDELLTLHRGMNKTFLFVTHDIEEAFKLGTRVMIMNEGHILQFDTPEEIILHPADGFVKSLVDSARAKEQFWEKFRYPREYR